MVCLFLKVLVKIERHFIHRDIQRMQLFDENFPGHRFETQIHIQTHIRLNTILTLVTKNVIIKNDY